MTNLSWLDLIWCVIPVLMVGIIYWRWAGDIKELSVACIRMLIQLIGVGYVLIVIFNRPSWWASTLILSIMFIAAAWIAIRPVKQHQSILWPAAIALFLSVGTHLFISIVLVLDIEQWFAPRVLIPLGGMYLANTMTTISLTVERYFSELSYGHDDGPNFIWDFSSDCRALSNHDHDYVIGLLRAGQRYYFMAFK